MIRKAIASILLAGSVQAATITFTGVIDEAREDSLFQVGQIIVAHFNYNARNGQINHYVVTVGETTLSIAEKDGLVALNANASSGSVYYQIIDNSIITITLQSATPNGIIPPVEQFNLNDFSLNSNTFGHLTSLPIVHGH
jgi:hypothetical protein